MARNHTSQIYDPNTNTWQMPSLPADPAIQRRGKRERIAHAGQALQDSAHSALARGISQHLENIEDAHGGPRSAFIAANASGSADQRQHAQTALDSARQVVDSETQSAKAKAQTLKPLVMAACIPLPPQGTSPAVILDKKQDLLAFFDGMSRANVNAESQKMVRQAIKDGDKLTLFCLLGEPLKLRASALGLNQALLQRLYVEAQLDSEGPHPLAGSAIPAGAGAYVKAMGDVDAAIVEHSDAANAALDDLAQRGGLR